MTNEPKKKSKEKLKKLSEASRNGSITYQKVWSEAKASLRGKYSLMPKWRKKKDLKQLNLHLKELEKEQQNPKLTEGSK